MPSIPSKYEGRYCYHFTHIDNLNTIIEHGLLCTNLKEAAGLAHFNVASAGIQERRKTMEVTCGAKGVVHDYVPFYLCSVNPMFLQMVNTKNIDQQDFVILAVPLKAVIGNGAVFTDASANTQVAPNFYDDPQDLDKLNWAEIDSQKWSSHTDQLRHEKMAEVLVPRKIDISEVKTIIVFNKYPKKRVTEIFAEKEIDLPMFSYGYFNKGNFFYTKYKITGHEDTSLLTGPRVLRERFNKVISELNKQRSNRQGLEFPFANLYEALKAIREDFCAIAELEGINGLETENEVHQENVSDHTKKVVAKILISDYYKAANEEDRMILEFSAYLHDIGKGPKTKWPGGKQKAYPDHPADGAHMVERIMHEDIETLSPYQIRMIALLVIYHDLIGEVFGKNRGRQQVLDIVESRKEVEMLAAINKADVDAINWFWGMEYNGKIKAFIDWVAAEKGFK
ncbi:DUF4433 domain-containing protein [Pedobacter sp. HMWF019]|uniref:DUF4433 domain-containing protein n=1 Tax=Pedobacter sp. HMWF019 TaxID=2056856 RepID=UPI000D385D71|nr:DUF4433 domain-containing protein [Pedobacter sp. HMWF019]PTS98418.1 DUF4433 domain-containing protein [Pedobacter sp. HMWF019]